MDHKAWLWKKRSTEKTLVDADKLNSSLEGHVEEMQTLQNQKLELERDLKFLGEKLSSSSSESNAKEEIAKEQAKVAQKAIVGWEKAEAEAKSLKRELDKAIQQRLASEERLINLDAALKECMQQLRFVREEQEKRIHDTFVKASREFEKTRIILEEKLAETNKTIAKLDGENNQLSKALLAKEKVMEGLYEHRAGAEADFRALMTRLESKEKESASLKYEVCVLEKELEIRNEEREFNRRTADMAQKQHLESVKKIAKLESECQRLRLLIRKRLPGPASLAKMKSEVDILGRGMTETRRRKSNSCSAGSVDFSVNSDDTPSTRINFLTEQLYAMEEENRILKETLNDKTNEFHFSKGQTDVKPAMNLHTPHETSLALMSDMGSDEKISCAESWASGSISEFGQFRNGKQTETLSYRTVGASDINLMDDFVEMEKLAIVSIDRSSILGPSNGYIDSNVSSAKKIDQVLDSDVSISVGKMIELIDGISLPSPHYATSEMPTDYMVRVFQWKTSDLSAVLQKFVQTCKDLLNGKKDVENFAKELTSSLEWIVNHCFSIQDVSSNWDESRVEGEVEGGMNNVVEESKRLKDELSNVESEKKDLELRLQLEINKSESLMIRLEESEKLIKSLKNETDTLKNSKGMIEDQIKNLDMVKENLDTRLAMIKVELNEACENNLSLQEDLEYKNNCCQELEAKCLELQLQLESLTKKEIQNHDMELEEKKIPNDLEVTSASEKLAECQETILNLGKQLKSLASPREAALFEKVISTPIPFDTTITTAIQDKNIKRRSTLLDKMLAEDNAETRDPRSPQSKELICDSNSPTGDVSYRSSHGLNGTIDSSEGFLNINGTKRHDEDAVVDNSLAIVSSKKKGGNKLLTKLTRRRKQKGKSQKKNLPTCCMMTNVK